MTEFSDTGSAWVDQSTKTVSDQIRALDRAGYPRAEIARRLGKRYQHVRNVLEGDKTRGSTPEARPTTSEGFQSAAGISGTFYRLVVARDGTLTLPREVGRAMGVSPGSVVVGKLTGPDLSLTSSLVSAQRARDRVRSLNPRGESMVDSLIADRRREAAGEADD